MTNFNKNETDAIEKFLQNFVNSALKTLSRELDKDVYKKVEFSIKSCQEVNSLETLKEEGRMIYKLDYSKGGFLGTLAALLPEDFIASLSDVITGGTGDDAYSGSLSELEINSIKDLLKKVFVGIESSFKNAYTNDFGFSNEPLILLKEMPNYENEFNSNEFDFLVDMQLVVNGKNEYVVSLLLNSAELRKPLASLNVFQGGAERANFHTNIDINQLSDIEIDITAELGSTRIPVKYALELVRGSLVKLETLNDSDIKVYANNVEVARAQVVVVGENFGLRITKIIAPEERIKLV